MCGRYLLLDDQDIVEIQKIIIQVSSANAEAAVRMKTGEIFPTDLVPVITNGEGEVEIQSWGFPKWDGKGVIINARSETALEKRMFHKPLQQTRCVVPSTGFFEWKKEGSRKEKYRIQIPDSNMLYMAGFYNTFSTLAGAQKSFVILTTAANESMAVLHERMPVLLSESEIGAYIRGENLTEVLTRQPVPIVFIPVA